MCQNDLSSKEKKRKLQMKNKLDKHDKCDKHVPSSALFNGGHWLWEQLQ